MSVCVVAEYPWAGIRNVPGLDPPGVIVCSDTRVTRGTRAEPWLCSKQSLVARNILVCYTSSHAEATSLALHRALGTRSVKALGAALKRSHDEYSGFAEAIAVVWRGKSPAQVLELMPPHYRPVHRTGIVGIGDWGVLDWFRANFREDADTSQQTELPEEMSRAWERQFGERLVLPPPLLPIVTAALHVGAALSRGIELAGSQFVSLPVQLMTISGGGVQQLQMVGSEDLNTWQDMTVDRRKTRLPTPKPLRANQPTQRRRAIQLFS